MIQEIKLPKRRAIAQEKKKTKISAAETPVKIIPLGGLGEIGKNMTVIEYDEDIIVIDCGMTFPEDDMLGIDYVIPDTQYLVKNSGKIKAFIITHGHEDHIGAIAHVVKDFPTVPIYSAKLTIALIENKLQENKINGADLRVVKAGNSVKCGCFEIKFISVCHSIADAMALAIKTPAGTIVHSGDFKIDHTPLGEQKLDFSTFAKLGDSGVLLLMSDSTNSERPGYTLSEQQIMKTIDDCIEHAEGRILVATFSSNINRIQQVIKIAENRNRRIFFAGKSIERISRLAMDIGYLDIKKGTLIDEKRLDYLEPNEVVIITTGSQGEPMSGLVRMANNEHKQIHIRAGDTVIISASPIPGNEKAVSNVINKLIKQGANVIYEGMRDVHVSGHAFQEEQKLMIALTRPRFFMPVHGEIKHLNIHAKTAMSQGIENGNIVVAQNGDVIELTKKSIKITGKVPANAVLVDGIGIGDVGSVVMRDRKMLSEDGLLIAIMALDSKTGKLSANPEVISRGFVYVKENELMMDEVRDIIKKIIFENEDKYSPGDWTSLKSTLRSAIRSYLYSKTQRNPMILPVIIETGGRLL